MAKTKKGQTATGQGRTVADVDVPVVYQEGVPEIYIDGFQGVIVKGGIAKLNLFSDIQNPASDEMERRIVAHLTMPVVVLGAVHDALGRLISNMERDGLVQLVPAEPEAKK